jgi:hypothetical protein
MVIVYESLRILDSAACVQVPCEQLSTIVRVWFDSWLNWLCGLGRRALACHLQRDDGPAGRDD